MYANVRYTGRGRVERYVARKKIGQYGARTRDIRVISTTL